MRANPSARLGSWSVGFPVSILWADSRFSWALCQVMRTAGKVARGPQQSSLSRPGRSEEWSPGTERKAWMKDKVAKDLLENGLASCPRAPAFLLCFSLVSVAKVRIVPNVNSSSSQVASGSSVCASRRSGSSAEGMSSSRVP